MYFYMGYLSALKQSVYDSGSPVATGYLKCARATWNLYLVAQLGYQEFEHCYRLHVKVLQLSDAVQDNANRINLVGNSNYRIFR